MAVRWTPPDRPFLRLADAPPARRSTRRGDSPTLLWKLQQEGRRQGPAWVKRALRPAAGEGGGPGPGEHAPKVCPFCGDVASLEFYHLAPKDMDDLTEGQFAEYMAGTWGTVYCTTYTEVFAYQM